MVVHIYTDGGSRGNPGDAAIGIDIRAGERVLFQKGEVIGRATNNEAEYTAVLSSLQWLQKEAESLQVDRVSWFLDSKLVVEQLMKRWKIKDQRMKAFADEIWQQLDTLSLPYSFSHIPRAENAVADSLVNAALDEAAR